MDEKFVIKNNYITFLDQLSSNERKKAFNYLQILMYGDVVFNYKEFKKEQPNQ